MTNLDNIVINLFTKLMKNVKPDICEEYILTNRSMFEKTNNSDWQKYRGMVSLFPGAKNIKLDYDTVVKTLETSRPDILAVICSTKNGTQWLKDQIKFCRIKMGLDNPKFTRI